MKRKNKSLANARGDGNSKESSKMSQMQNPADISDSVSYVQRSGLRGSRILAEKLVQDQYEPAVDKKNKNVMKPQYDVKSNSVHGS